MPFEPTEAGKAFPEDDIRRWLDDEERAVLEAFDCPDIQASISVSVKLEEFREKRKPKKLTEEQSARERAASKHIEWRFAGYGSVRRLLAALATHRWALAGSPGATAKES
jgi:hypothetical protein